MSMSIGCVGCGNMGGAILAGLAASSLDCTLYGHTRTAARMAPLEAAGVTRLDSARELARKARYVVMAVKPYQIEALLAEMAPEFGPDTVVISVAAGISIARLQAAVGGRCPVVRCMPNTPALVGKGVFALCFDDKVPAESKEDILRFFSQLGVCLELPESRFTAFSALIGAGPAYVFGMMQGLVQAGVTLGLGRKECRDMVAALFEGSAVMAARSDTPLMELRDQVCSPGGLTIAALPVIWYGLMDEDKRMRFITLFNPDLDPTGSGYQQRLGRIALGSGKLWGKGIFSGNHQYVPEMYNDFIFSFIGEALGFIGCLAVLGIISALCRWAAGLRTGWDGSSVWASFR